MTKWITTMMVTMMPLMSYASESVLFEQLTKDQLESFFAGEKKAPIIEVQKGLQLPVSFFLTGDLLDLEDHSSLMIHMKESFFVKKISSTFLFSSDLEHWVPLSAFIQGQICVVIDSEQQERGIRLGGEVNRRIIK